PMLGLSVSVGVYTVVSTGWTVGTVPSGLGQLPLGVGSLSTGPPPVFGSLGPVPSLVQALSDTKTSSRAGRNGRRDILDSGTGESSREPAILCPAASRVPGDGSGNEEQARCQVEAMR